MGSIKMCVRTVEGEPVETLRTVSGEDGDYRTVSGEDFGFRNVSGLSTSQAVFMGTRPTITQLTTPGTGSYTTPTGCFYIEVYAVGPGGGGSGGTSNAARPVGGAGGGGGCGFKIFGAGTYAYTVASGGAGGATTDLPGSAGSGPTIFGTMQATSGAGGEAALFAGNSYFGGANGTVSGGTVFAIGRVPAEPPGLQGSRGGGNLFNSKPGAGRTFTSGVTGFGGESGGGGGGGCFATGAGGDGGDGNITIIEYY